MRDISAANCRVCKRSANDDCGAVVLVIDGLADDAAGVTDVADAPVGITANDAALANVAVDSQQTKAQNRIDICIHGYLGDHYI